MKSPLQFLLLISGLFFSLILLPGCEKEDLQTPSDALLENRSHQDLARKALFYGLTQDQQLIQFASGRTYREIGQMPITGLPAGELLLAIDFRPATGQLYGVSDRNLLYQINTNSGRATAISSTPFTPGINGKLAGFDFNPTVDRIRLVTENEQNLRLHPETGAVVAIDGDLNPGDQDINAVAYTNSFAGTTSTTLYDADFQQDKLFRQNPPNGGGLELVGTMGTGIKGDGGFDISPDNKVAIAVVTNIPKGIEGNAAYGQNVRSRFFRIDLNTGKATPAGTSQLSIIGIAIASDPIAYAVDRSGQLLIMNPERPGSMIVKTISGLMPGDAIVGIDMRPATGQLYALGKSSRFYVINMANGAATVVGTQPFSQRLNGNWFGFDFNPTVDRIRIVSDKGQNLRMHPVTGDVAFVDGGLQPGNPQISAAAYTNNFAGATTTTLYVIDHMTNMLMSQIPPNDGILNAISLLSMDITEYNGFDIGSNTGRAWGIFSTLQQSFLAEVNLASGQMMMIMPMQDDVVGFTVGLNQ